MTAQMGYGIPITEEEADVTVSLTGEVEVKNDVGPPLNINGDVDATIADALIITPVDRQAILHTEIISVTETSASPIGDLVTGEIFDKNRISAVCSSTVNGTLYIQQSYDSGVTWPDSTTFDVIGGVPKVAFVDVTLTLARVWFDPILSGTVTLHAHSIA